MVREYQPWGEVFCELRHRSRFGRGERVFSHKIPRRGRGEALREFYPPRLLPPRGVVQVQIRSLDIRFPPVGKRKPENIQFFGVFVYLTPRRDLPRDKIDAVGVNHGNNIYRSAVKDFSRVVIAESAFRYERVAEHLDEFDKKKRRYPFVRMVRSVVGHDFFAAPEPQRCDVFPERASAYRKERKKRISCAERTEQNVHNVRRKA